MKASLVLPVALLITLQLSLGQSEETATTDNEHEDSSQHALSREKRGSYNMMRLGRGLRMLRLGKRSQPDLPSLPQDDMLAMLQEYYSQFPGAQNEIPLDSEIHPRFRRSTSHPATVMVDPQDNESSQEVGAADGDFGEEFGFYPEEVYGNLEDLYEPVEGGEELDESFLDGSSADEEGFDGNSDISKRPMSMLRLGKRPMSMLRLGKRPMSMLRLGKRPMSMLRLGKRPMSMLRLGKRPMSMLRLGKRPMSMLRLGKRPMSMLRLGKRPMSMLRLGKRPMSMLRLGKRPVTMLRLGKRQLKMLRLGKREAEKAEENNMFPLEESA